MKLKNKLIGILGIAPVVTMSLTTVIACSKEKPKTPVEPIDDPDGWKINLAYRGTNKTSLMQTGTSKVNIGPFQLSTPLGMGETVSIESSNPEIAITNPTPVTLDSTFYVEVYLKNGQPTENTTYEFNLKFNFSRTFNDQKQQTSKLVSGFKIKFYVGYLANPISWETLGGSPAASQFTLPEGQTEWMVENFILDHPLIDGETVQVAISDAGTHLIDAILIDEDKTDNRLAVKYAVKDDPITSYEAFDFTTTLTTYYESVAQPNPLVKPMSVKLNERYVPRTLLVDSTWSPLNQFITPVGVGGILIDSYDPNEDHKYFALDNPLRDNESVEVYCNNPNVDVSMAITEERNPNHPTWNYIDLGCSINNIYDPYTTKTETFALTFLFYYGEELKAVVPVLGADGNELQFQINYTPIETPAPVPEDTYGIVFDPVIIDYDGDMSIQLNAAVGKKGAETEDEAGLKVGDYLTIENVSTDAEQKTDNKSWQFFESMPMYKSVEDPDTREHHKELTGWGTTIEGQGSNLIPLSSARSGWAVYEGGIWEYPCTFKATFWHGNPIGLFEDLSEDVTELSSMNADTTIIHYEPGFWKTDSLTATDMWIQYHSLLLMCSYNQIAGDESSRKYIFGTAWIINPNIESTSYGGLELLFVTSDDVMREMKPITSMSNEDKELHDVKLGYAVPNSGKQKTFSDLTKYITLDDFIYLSPTTDHVIVYPFGPEEDPIILDVDALTWKDENFVWSGNDDLNGCNIAVGSINLLWFDAEMPLSPDDEDDIDPKYMEYYIKYSKLVEPSVFTAMRLADTEEGGTGYMTDLAQCPSVNQNSFANAVCSGFEQTTIKNSLGQDEMAFFWKTISIESGLGHSLRYQPQDPTQGPIKQFPDLGETEDGDVIKHMTPAYRMSDEFSLTDKKNGWFSSMAGSGAMCVVREWKEYGVEMDIPRVVGINWNGGDINGSSINPWIDIFYTEQGNLLENYYFPIYG